LVAPYDSVAYAVEFFAGDPGLKGAGDTLQVILSSFALGKTEWNFPLIAIFAGMTLFMVSVLRSRSQTWPPPGGATGGGAGSAPPGDADPPASGPFS
jgi:hypothetical protein